MALEQIAFNIAAFKNAYANGANYYTNKLYAVHKLDDTLADIYSDPIGAYPIQQNGQDNKSDASGEVIFYIDPLGDYYIQVDGKRRDLKFSSAFVKRDEVDDIIESNGEVTNIGKDLNQALDDILALRDESDGTIKPNLQLETIKREDSDKALFNTTAALAQFRRESNSEINNLTDATFVVDPASGTINLRAFNYADDKFTQAGILIDGVDARVSINAGKITDLGTSVINANASIDVLAGQIELKASYTQMTEYVAGALDAITPAYSFSFFNSFEGWSAVNGVMTQGNIFIATTFGDIQNQSLSYPADENPVITISIKRIAGSGHKGDLIVTFSGGSTQTYSGVITDSAIGEAQIKTLNLKENATYTGDVTGVRLVLGASVADEYQVNSITIGKPSAQLDALDGITAQVNQLGIDVNAIEGQLTSFVTTTFYNQNTVTLNNVTQVLDGEDAIISLKATQQELDSAGTITKANSAATWIDGANATIRNTVVSFNAEPGSVDDQLAGLTGGLNSVQQEVSALDGASIRNQLISVNRLETKSKDIEELQFYTELKLLEQQDNDLKIGDSVATADSQIKTLTTDTEGLAQEITTLKASTGVLGGQINANVREISQTNTRINGTARALAGLTTEVENTKGELSQSQLILDSTIDELGVVSSRAYLGVSSVVGGKSVITGVTADSATRGLRFQGDKIQFDDTSGNRALYYNSSKNKWTLDGELIIGGYTVESEADIRGLDGQSGAGFYGSLYASISWNTTTATQRFTALVGRSPVQYDIFTQTRTDGTDSQTKSFKNGLWVAPSLLVNGDIIATGSINGNRFQAETEITAPIISGGTIKLVGTRFMEYWSATPFGVDQLIEWYGEKVSGINWNTSTQQPIPSGMLKSNSKTYKSASGDVYFGGTFLAGTLSSSQSSTELISTPSTSVMFGSNGGIIVVSASYSFNTTKRGNVSGAPDQTAICPTSPLLSVVTGTLFLERKSGSNWIVVKQQAISGSYNCQNGEYVGQTGNIPYRASSSSGSVFSYTDSLRSSSNREYRVRASLNNFYYTGTTKQYISVVTSE